MAVSLESEWLTSPPLEINVTVMVKLKDKANPIVYNRVYLPEVKYIKCSDVNLADMYHAAQKKAVNPLQEGHRDLYDYEIKRIYDKIKNMYPDIIM